MKVYQNTVSLISNGDSLTVYTMDMDTHTYHVPKSAASFKPHIPLHPHTHGNTRGGRALEVGFLR
jgi:hypothetical protein